MKCIFLYNPNSGKGKIVKKLPLIERKLHTRYDEVTIRATSDAEDLERCVRESAERYDAVIFSGGDGTFNHVIRGAENLPVQLGYIPGGTVNDVARSLKIPRSVRGALNVILKGESRSLDCLKINDSEYAMYIAAAGAFTRATYTTDQKKKRAFGALAYAVEAVRNNLRLDVFPLKIRCGEFTAETDAVLILVMNGRSVAGFPINKKGSMCDEVLEVAVIKQVRQPNLFRRIGALFSVATLFVFGCRIKRRDVLFFRGKNVEIETSDNVVWDFDGEEGIKGNVQIGVCPKNVRLFVPKKKNL